MKSVIRGAGYVLAHTPDMVLHNGTTQTTERIVNPDSEYLKELPSHIRSFEQAVAYWPNQVYIGNKTPDELAAVAQPWCDKECDCHERYGKFGQMMPQNEFLLLMQACDVFDLVELEAEFVAANREALAFLAGQGRTEYTPSVELTAQELRQMDAAGGHRELIVYGRLPLMQLRHCPIRAALDGPHASCRRCDSLSEDKRLNAHVLIDRKNVAFPLRRVRSDEGCLVRVLNSAPLFLLRHAGRLPESAAWRLMLTDETAEEAQSIVRLHRLAIEGGDVRASDDWPAWDAKNTTTGYYFR